MMDSFTHEQATAAAPEAATYESPALVPLGEFSEDTLGAIGSAPDGSVSKGKQ